MSDQRLIRTECKSDTATSLAETNLSATQAAKPRGEGPGSGGVSDCEPDCDQVDSKAALQHVLHLSSRSEGAGTSQTQDDDQLDEETEDQEPLTHVELTSVFRNTLSTLLSEDPLLSDLADMALNPAVVKSLIALEKGTAMAILVNRSHKVTRVIVERTATVRDLKTAIRSAVELEQERQRRGRRRAISWRYVWRANWLCFGGKQLKDDNARLSELGMSNKSEVCFVQRIRRKRGQLIKKAGQLQD